MSVDAKELYRFLTLSRTGRNEDSTLTSSMSRAKVPLSEDQYSSHEENHLEVILSPRNDEDRGISLKGTK